MTIVIARFLSKFAKKETTQNAACNLVPAQFCWKRGLKTSKWTSFRGFQISVTPCSESPGVIIRQCKRVCVCFWRVTLFPLPRSRSHWIWQVKETEHQSMTANNDPLLPLHTHIHTFNPALVKSFLFYLEQTLKASLMRLQAAFHPGS